MSAKKVSDPDELTAGQVNPEHLAGLLELTGIRSEALISALKDHLLNGVPSTEAWSKHGVNKSQGSRRLSALKEKDKQVRAIIRFYQKG